MTGVFPFLPLHPKEPYHGRILTILWDETGTKYGKGAGLRIFADGLEILQSKTLGRVARPLTRHGSLKRIKEKLSNRINFLSPDYHPKVL